MPTDGACVNCWKRNEKRRGRQRKQPEPVIRVCMSLYVLFVMQMNVPETEH